MMKLYCNTGDPLLDEAAALLMESAAEAVAEPSGRLVLSFRAEDAAAGDGLILLYRGEAAPTCFFPRVRLLRYPYAIEALERAVRELLAEGSRGGSSEAAPPAEAASHIAPVFDGRSVTLGSRSVALSGKEAAVFAVLYEKRGEPVPRELLCRRVWGRVRETNLCDVYICRLRNALTPMLGKGFLVNIRGAGYLLRI